MHKLASQSIWNGFDGLPNRLRSRVCGMSAGVKPRCKWAGDLPAQCPAGQAFLPAAIF